MHMRAVNLSAIRKSEMCGSFLIKKIISCKLTWNILSLLLFFSPIKQAFCKKCKIYYEREHANFPNIAAVCLREGGDEGWENISLRAHSHSPRARALPITRACVRPRSWV